MIKEALAYLFTKGAESTSAKEKLHVFDREHEVIWVKADGTVDKTAARLNLQEECNLVCGIDGAISFCKSQSVSMTVLVNAYHIEIASAGDDVTCPFHVHFEIPQRAEWRMLKKSFESPQWKSVPEMLRFIRVCDFQMTNQREVLQSLDSFSWKTTTNTEASGVGNSRAAYGTQVQQEVEVDSPASLADPSCLISMLKDQRVRNITTLVNCFWEYDHPSQKIALTAEGGALRKLAEEQQDLLFNIFVEELGDSEFVTLLRGVS